MRSIRNGKLNAAQENVNNSYNNLGTCVDNSTILVLSVLEHDLLRDRFYMIGRQD